MRRLLAHVLLAVLTLVASCSKDEPKGAAKPIRLGYVPYSSSLPAFVAAERGLFEARKLVVKLRRFETSNEAMIALVTGKTDGVMGIGLASLLAIEHKTPGKFKMIWYAIETDANWVNALLVPTSSDVAGIEELRGQTVATFAGATQIMNLQAIFDKALGDSKSVTLSQISPNLQLQVLETGDVAALFAIEPQVTIALTRGLGRVLVDNPRCKYILDPFPAGGGILSTTLLSKRASDAEKLRGALDEAIELIRHDESGAKLLLPKYTPIEPEIAGKSRLYAWWKSKECNIDALQRLSDLLEENGILGGHIDVRQMVFVK
ncbi:MAG: ABC transporter substrate-binding protein [Planctomycetes bacterium]|nr:ABC transporter substrate-binding protein [Planctomycetota bacterium]